MPPTCREFGWRPGRRPKTKWTTACRVAALHDRANRQPGLTSAFAACQHARAGRDVERNARYPTVRTDKTVLPAQLFEICSTGHIIREEPLKFWKRLRKRQRGVLIDVHHDRRRCIHSCSGPVEKSVY
jgi:hypothetical protein